jgi:hypothetical protein
VFAWGPLLSVSHECSVGYDEEVVWGKLAGRGGRSSRPSGRFTAGGLQVKPWQG